MDTGFETTLLFAKGDELAMKLSNLQSAVLNLLQNLRIALSQLTDTYELIIEIQQNLSEQMNIISQLQNQILKKLLWRYQKQQITKKSGTITLTLLNMLKERFTGLLEIIQKTESHINEMENIQNTNSVLMNNDSINRLKLQIMNQLAQLLKAALVPELPSQFIKIATETLTFPTTIKLMNLLGDKSDIESSTVSVFLLTELEAKKLSRRNLVDHNKAKLISGAELKHFTYQQDIKMFSANFENCILENFKDRSEAKKRKKNATVLVMEEKYYLYFEVSLSFRKMLLNTWTLSWPCVITSHHSQYPPAYATIFWYNSFTRDINQEPAFDVPASVPWTKFDEHICLEFFILTERKLSQQDRLTLKRKLIGEYESEVKHVSFSKDNMVDRAFSFSTWLYGLIFLIQKYSTKENHKLDERVKIIDRETAEERLKHSAPGTFLIRFSESVLQAVTISCKLASGNIIHTNLVHKNKDLDRGLGNYITHCTDLITFYPDIPKANVFQADPSSSSGQNGREYVPLTNTYQFPNQTTSVTASPLASPNDHSAVSGSNYGNDGMDIDNSGVYYEAPHSENVSPYGGCLNGNPEGMPADIRGNSYTETGELAIAGNMTFLQPLLPSFRNLIGENINSPEQVILDRNLCNNEFSIDKDLLFQEKPADQNDQQLFYDYGCVPAEANENLYLQQYNNNTNYVQLS